MNRFKLKVALYDAKCTGLKYSRTLKNIFLAQSTHKFLFILCPEYCGSTLLQEILSTSPVVSPNNIFGTREGQSLPEFREMVNYKKRWDPDYEYPWQDIKRIWLKYWDTSKLFLLDKSPPNLLRADVIQEFFDPSYFIIMVRNPYVHTVSMMRKNKMAIETAAQHAISCLKFQKKNHDRLKNNVLIRYEDLCDETEEVKKKLIRFLPTLGKLNTDKEFNAHRTKPERITNMNKSKIDNLSIQDLELINSVFQEEEDLFRFFNYPIL